MDTNNTNYTNNTNRIAISIIRFISTHLYIGIALLV